MEPQQSQPTNSGAPGVMPEQGAPAPQPQVPAQPPLNPNPAPLPQPQPGRSKKGLIIGIVAVVVLVAGAALAFVLIRDNSSKTSSSNTPPTSNTAKAAPSTGTYENQKGGFSVAKPQGWKISMEGEIGGIAGSSGATFVPEQEQQSEWFALGVYGTPVPEGKTFKEVIDQGLKVYESFPGYQQLDRRDYKVGGNEAVYMEVKYKIDTLEIHQSQIAIFKGGKVHTVTCTFPESDWAKNQGVVKLMNDSFKVN